MKSAMALPVSEPEKVNSPLQYTQNVVACMGRIKLAPNCIWWEPLIKLKSSENWYVVVFTKPGVANPPALMKSPVMLILEKLGSAVYMPWTPISVGVRIGT